MHLHTFTARSLPEALRLVRQALGSDASLLYTREVSAGLFHWWRGARIEVTAAAGSVVPSRLPERPAPTLPKRVGPADQTDFRTEMRHRLHESASRETSLIEQLCVASAETVQSQTS